ncbi:T-cell activation Rho GTPase-activating protein-like isoform 2-T2 [Theristicus caerulescens]
MAVGWDRSTRGEPAVQVPAPAAATSVACQNWEAGGTRRRRRQLSQALCTVEDRGCLRGAQAVRVRLQRVSLWPAPGSSLQEDSTLPQPLQVANRLPAANLLLFLRWLLSLLYNISQNSATSRMTASNLAIYIGPNLLSPAKDHLLPLEGSGEECL